MSNITIKKLPFAVKLTVILVVLAIVFLTLSIISAVYSVNRTVDAIDAIGQVEYTAASKEKIDLAISYYEALDPNIGLSKKITNADALTAAKFEYVRLGIKRAYVADIDGEAEVTVKQYVIEAREAFDEYCATGDCTSISNYEDLIALENKYISKSDTSNNSSSSDNNSNGEEEIELC